jgi:predicted extracellular nuclease
MRRSFVAALFAVLISSVALTARAQIRITEWMYDALSPTGATTPEGEYVELTNVGSTSVNMTGWSYDDSHEVAGTLSLTPFGPVAAGQSVIIAEAAAADFRTAWGLSNSVEVIGSVGHPTGNNLGRSDEINIYDNTNALIDRLTFNDQGTGNVKGPRTQDFSGNPSSLAVLGTNNASAWVLSSVGDAFGSHTSVNGNVGNPGVFAVPEPAAGLLMLLGGAFMLNQRVLRRRSA